MTGPSLHHDGAADEMDVPVEFFWIMSLLVLARIVMLLSLARNGAIAPTRLDRLHR